jgi:hypothetical protein
VCATRVVVRLGARFECRTHRCSCSSAPFNPLEVTPRYWPVGPDGGSRRYRQNPRGSNWPVSAWSSGEDRAKIREVAPGTQAKNLSY